MRVLSTLLIVLACSFANAQGSNTDFDTIPLNNSYLCDTFLNIGGTEIYVSIEPTQLVTWNYWMSNGVQGCNWKYELRYYIESNTPMYTLQGTINNTNFFNLPNSDCNSGCTGLVYTANNDAGDCASVDFDLTDIIRIQFQNADISYRNIPLNCSAISSLPVELVSFQGMNENRENTLWWSTITETDNDYFILERTQNGDNWEFVANLDGAGTTTEKQYYTYKDNTYSEGVNYYRLTQIDFDGSREHSNVISIDNSATGRTLVQIVNLLGETVKEDYSGLKIYVYSNGDVVKKY